MSDFRVRGYVISRTVGYINLAATEEGLPDPVERLSPESIAVIQNIAAQEWYPVSVISELNRLIVETIGQNDQERSRQALRACGRFMGQEASNTYLRILLRLLNPSLFSKKLPDFWRRDSTHGQIEVKVKDRTLSGRFVNVDGYDHLPAVATGFICFALENIGREIEDTVLHGWSFDKPASDGVRFAITWKE